MPFPAQKKKKSKKRKRCNTDSILVTKYGKSWWLNKPSLILHVL